MAHIFFQFQGRFHVVMVQFCGCEKKPLTLVKLHLWPAGAKEPSTAFHFDLLKVCSTFISFNIIL